MKMPKRFLSFVLAMLMCFAILPGGSLKVDAESPNYTVSSSYRNSTYYSALCNVGLTGNQRQDIVNIALSQVGYREGSSTNDYGGADDGSYNNYTEYNYWYHNYVSSGMPVGGDSAPWCATFVSWCAAQANIPTSVLRRSTAAGHGASYFNINFYSGSSTLASSADNDSYFKGYNYTPKMGDLFYTRSWSHVGLVVSVNGAYVTTVEGNTNNNGSSQGNGVYKLTSRRISDLYFGVPNYSGSTPTNHIVDSSYSKNVTCYPKAKITAGNIFDANHNQISSTAWIGTSDLCTIHEVYTDGCCKVSYPLDSGGTQTVYSKISLFNIHTHNYTGTRVQETVHPHIVTQRCVDYATCGGYIVTGEYGQSTTCQQCWHIDWSVSASSMSVKVGGSESIKLSISGVWPDSAKVFSEWDQSLFNYTLSQGVLTVTGLKSGTGKIQISVYSDANKSVLIGEKTISVSVYDPIKTLVGIKAYPPNKNLYYMGESFDTSGLTLRLDYSDGSTSVIYSGYTVSGFDSSIEGRKTVTVSYGGMTDYFEVMVIPSSVSLSHNSITLNLGETKTISATTDPVGGSVKWSVWDKSVVNVSNGKVTAVGEGRTKIEVAFEWLGYYSFASCDVVVNAPTYTVSYNANGGTGAPKDQTKKHGTDLDITSSVPTGKSYTVTYNTNGGEYKGFSLNVYKTFSKWNTKADGSGIDYVTGGSFDIDANTTLYAQWNNAVMGSYKVPTRQGYSFIGWFDSKSTNYDGYPLGKIYSSNSEITSDITLYAMWLPDSYLLFGDCTRDGIVDSEDYSLLNKVRLGKQTPDYDLQEFYLRSDLNRDGILDFKDVIIVEQLSDNEISQTQFWDEDYQMKITQYPKESYHIGDDISSEGLQIKIVLDSGASYDITKDLKISEYDSKKIGYQSIYVSYYQFNGIKYSVKVEDHNYKNIVTAPTCTAQGYTTHTCTACSHSYKDTYTAVKSHSYVQGVCSGCGAKDPNFNATKVTLESKTARAGDTVTLNLKLEKKLNVKSIGINNISFDSTKLELVSGEWLLKGTTIADFNVTSKSAAATFTANTAIEGSVLKLTFKVKDGVAEGDIAISFNVQAKQVNNGKEEAIALQAVSGKVTVTKVLLGDVDGNNIVDSDDAIYLLYNTLFGAESYPLTQTADFDGNGMTDSDDAIYLLYHTLFGAGDYPLK